MRAPEGRDAIGDRSPLNTHIRCLDEGHAMKFEVLRTNNMKLRTGLKAGQGLGDAVADLTHLTGVDRLAQAYTQVTGRDCGCKARQEKLNQLFSLPQIRPSA